MIIHFSEISFAFLGGDPVVKRSGKNLNDSSSSPEQPKEVSIKGMIKKRNSESLSFILPN